MHKLSVFALAALVLALAVQVHAQGSVVTTRSQPPDPSRVDLVQVASGFNRPLYVTHAGDGSGRLFVVQQGGRIRIVENGEMMDPPFLDVSDRLSPDVFNGSYTERGLLGMAFHPDFERNGYFYINYTDVNGDTVIARYTISADNPNVADPASATTIMTFNQPYGNHNGGHLAFGPDGYLYIASGDGGSHGDPLGNAQNKGVVLGKILRIDVDGGSPYSIPPDNPFSRDPEFAPEVWAYGLRNPWRFSFDAATGDLYIGDVGQNQWEEINFEPADSPGGVNYGWNFFEGSHQYTAGPLPENLVFPIAEYHHSQGVSVSGGYVYRGRAVPELEGVYLYADFGYGTIWYAYRDEAGQWHSDVFLPPTGYTISSFGVDEDNELYVVDYRGVILRFAAAQ